MDITHTVPTEILFAEAIVSDDGSLHLTSPRPMLNPGDRVVLAISPGIELTETSAEPGVSIIPRHDRPFDPALLPAEWDLVRDGGQTSTIGQGVAAHHCRRSARYGHITTR